MAYTIIVLLLACGANAEDIYINIIILGSRIALEFTVNHVCGALIRVLTILNVRNNQKKTIVYNITVTMS